MSTYVSEIQKCSVCLSIISVYVRYMRKCVKLSSMQIWYDQLQFPVQSQALNALSQFMIASQLKRLIPLICLYIKYVSTLSRLLTQLCLAKRLKIGVNNQPGFVQRKQNLFTSIISMAYKLKQTTTTTTTKKYRNNKA